MSEEAETASGAGLLARLMGSLSLWSRPAGPQTPTQPAAPSAAQAESAPAAEESQPCPESSPACPVDRSGSGSGSDGENPYSIFGLATPSRQGQPESADRGEERPARVKSGKKNW